MLSTIHTGMLINSGKKTRITGEEIRKPDVIVNYNSTMGGVDTLSRVIVPYMCQRRGVKWYRKLAKLFLEICVYNSFCIWQKLNPDKSFDNLKFRKLLIEELIMYHSHGSRPRQAGPQNCGGNPLRLFERHFISIYPNRCSKKKYPQVNCVRCYAMKKQKDTRYWCSKCGLGLCLLECFEVYHTKLDYTKPVEEEEDSETVENIEEPFDPEIN